MENNLDEELIKIQNAAAEKLSKIELDQVNLTEIKDLCKDIIKFENPEIDINNLDVQFKHSLGLSPYAAKLKNLSFNEENYKGVLDIINKIEDIYDKIHPEEKVEPITISTENFENSVIKIEPELLQNYANLPLKYVDKISDFDLTALRTSISNNIQKIIELSENPENFKNELEINKSYLNYMKESGRDQFFMPGGKENFEVYQDILETCWKYYEQSVSTEIKEKEILLAENNNNSIEMENNNSQDVKIISYFNKNFFTGENIERGESFRNQLIKEGYINNNDDVMLLTEAQAKKAGSEIKKDSPFVLMLCPPNDNFDDWHYDRYYHTSAIENTIKFNQYVKELDLPEIEDNSVSNNEQKEDLFVFGKTVLQPFVAQTDKGMLIFENGVIKNYDKETGKFIIDNGDQQISLSRTALENILKEPEIQKKDNVIDITDEEPVKIKTEYSKGTVLPDFSMITGDNILHSYKNMELIGFDKASDSYKLSNGKNTLILSAETFKELNSEENREKIASLSEDSPIYEKMVKTQYHDYFEERDNNHYNFRHNLSVRCRKETNSPIEALQVAKELIKEMPKKEQHKTKELLKTLARNGQSINELIVEMYKDAISTVPLNENYIKNNYPEEKIARKMPDTIITTGAKINSDPSLIVFENGNKVDKNLQVGQTVNIQLKSNELFGDKSKMKLDLTIVASTEEGNMITFMDDNKSFIQVPRDEVLSQYKNQVLRQQNNKRKEQSIEIELR